MELSKISIVFYCLLFFLTVFISCSTSTDNTSLKRFKGEYRKIAKAVEKEDTLAIKKIVKAKELNVNYQEPEFGGTLLMWAVDNNKYASSKVLLKLGANPNLKSFDNKTSALMFSAKKYETSDYLKLLLEYGGNANDFSDFQGVNYLRTPLIAASSTRLESVKILIEAGANVNYMSHHQTALRIAIDSKYIDIARYLIIEKDAKFNMPLGTTIHGDTIYIINSLRRCVFPLESEDYKTKMEIVDYMLERGENYWKTPIPQHYYKNYDSVYLSKY